MPAIDTVFSFATNPGATITATTVSPGDSLTVRSFPQTSPAYLLQLVRRGATAGVARVRSPRFHDNVTGINLRTAEVVSTLGFPRRLSQPLYSADTLILEVNGGGAETDCAGMLIYYNQLQGVNARLAMWGQVSGIVKSVKLFQTAVTNSATIGTWTDTVVTTTENQFHADADYAVLGYITDTAQGFVGVKGPETGNLRVCGPGTTVGLDTVDWFAQLSDAIGMACIPVFNTNNRASTYVSTVDSAASSTPTVTLVCAELSQPAPV